MRDLNDREATGNWPALPWLVALVLGWLAIGWPWISGRVTIPWDAKAHFQPQAQFLAQSLASGDSPFWAPYVFSGHPQIADPQSLIFSPPYLALALVDRAPSLWALDLTLLAAILVGGAALMLWFRDRGWHPAGAVIAALAFAFGSSMAWRNQHVGQVLSLAMLPVVQLLLERALVRRSVLYGAAAGVAAGFLVLGRDQVALLAVYLLAGYVASELLAGRRPVGEAVRASLAPLSAGLIAGLAVVAVPVLLTAMLAGDSNRPEISLLEAGRGSLHPAHLLTLFAPDLFSSSAEMADYWGPPSNAWAGTDLWIAQNVGQMYVGAAPMILVLLGLASGMLWHRDVRYFSLALAFMLLYALGKYTPAFHWFYDLLPGVKLYRRPADATFEIGYLLAITGGYVAHRLLSDPLSRVGRRSVILAMDGVLAAFVVAAVVTTVFHRWGQAWPHVAVAAALFAGAAAAIYWAWWLNPLRPVTAGLILAAFTVGDLAYSNGPGSATARPPAMYDVLEPTTRNETIRLLLRKVAADADRGLRDRVELVGLGFHWPNACLTHKLECTLGYNPLRSGLYSRATGAGDNIGLPEERKFSALFPSYRSPLADLLGLRYIASSVPIEQVDRRLAPGDLALIARTPDAYVYENPRALPRVLFARQAQAADFDRLLATGQWPGVDLQQTVLLGPADATTGPPRRPGRARIQSYRNTEVVVSVESPDGGWVVLNDVWHPWWTAEVDGQPASLLRANVLFRAVAVPAGRHEVRFVFRPLAGAWAELMGRWRH
jgi:hypothetical protein